ncbi:RHS repeat-associated core domain-containing protein [Delftia tsuruhatensis]
MEMRNPANPANPVNPAPAGRTSRWNRLFAGLLLVAAACMPQQALAQPAAPASYRLFIDADANPATGCSAAVADRHGNADIEGIEYLIQVRVDDGSGPVTIAKCRDGVFGNAIPAGSAAAQWAEHSKNGQDIVQVQWALSLHDLGLSDGEAIALSLDSGGDYLPQAGGAPIVYQLAAPAPAGTAPIPAMAPAALACLSVILAWAAWRYRRRTGMHMAAVLLVAATLGMAGGGRAQGLLADWSGLSPVATDPAGDHVPGRPDLLALWVAQQGEQLLIRIDAELTGATDTTDTASADPLGLRQPRMQPASAQLLQVGKAWRLTVSATDAEGAPATVQLLPASAAPPALQAAGNAQGGVALQWQPAPPDVGEHVLEFLVTDSADQQVRQSMLLSVSDPGDVPADAASRAGVLQPGTPFAEATAFLYTGADPIQRGVRPGTIVDERAIVLRGRVTDAGGRPLPGVTVKVWGRPEYGHTLTRADGWFDLAANGGGLMVLEYAMPGHLRVQRKVDTRWRDYAIAEEVALIALDARATPVAMDSDQWQLGQGSRSSDRRGARTAMALFPPGTSAALAFADGSTRPLPGITFRATEFTVGDTGPRAMPGELPISVGYTYAVELSADEAIAAGAQSVQFSQPVPVYVDNFLGFPVGTTVPLGWYDYARAAWIGADNGRAIQLLAVEDGQAVLQVTEQARAATAGELAELGITPGELSALARLHAPGASLWRVTLSHFTPWDLNVPYGPPPDADEPPPPGKDDSPDQKDCRSGQYCCPKPGCDIYPSQALGQSIPIPGAPFDLYYDSRKAGSVAYRIPLLKQDRPVPASLQQIRVRVDIAGRRIEHLESGRAPRPFVQGMAWDLRWDGKDAYGRTLMQGARADITVSHVYPLIHYAVGSSGAGGGGGGGRNAASSAFAALSARTSAGVGISRNSANTELYTTYRWHSFWNVGSPDLALSGAGGWALTGLKYYDASSKRLHTGGGQVETAAQSAQEFRPVARVQGAVLKPGLLPQADGRFLAFSDSAVVLLGRDGRTEPVAGRPGAAGSGYSGDGGPATAAAFSDIRQIRQGLDGSIYVLDQGGQALRHIRRDGKVHTIAGDGTWDPARRNRPGKATQATIDITNFTVDRDGNLFYPALQGIAQIAAHGELSLVAGAHSPQYFNQVSTDPAGGLWASDGAGHLYFIAPGGQMRHIAGGGAQDGDGPGLVLDLGFGGGMFLADGQGGLYFQGGRSSHVRHMDSSGWVATLGVGTAFAITPDGERWQLKGGSLGKLASVFPDYGSASSSIVRSDGLIVDRFDRYGKQVDSLVGVTGAQTLRYRYRGSLIAGTSDGQGNSVSIDRDAQGRISRITGMDGEVTTLDYNADGMLQAVASPGGVRHRMEYGTASGAGHLLTAYTDPRGHVDRFRWNGKLLAANENAVGGGWTLGASTATQDHTRYQITTLTSAEGRSFHYRVPDRRGYGGSQQVTFPDGQTRNWQSSSYGGSASWQVTHSNGASQVSSESLHVSETGHTRDAWSRLRLGSHLSAVDTSSTLKVDLQAQKLSGSRSVQKLRSTFQLGPDGVLHGTDARGRSSQARLDAWLRPLSTTPHEGAPTEYTWDARGRLSALQSTGNPGLSAAGAGMQKRSATATYHGAAPGKGQLASLTNALGQTRHFSYDLAGRLVRASQPGGSATHYSYDAAGNLLDLQTPAGIRHSFRYDAVNQPVEYKAPASATQWRYNLDGDLVQVQRPGGQSIGLTYDPTGRLEDIRSDASPIHYRYAANGTLSRIEQGSNAIDASYTDLVPSGLGWSGEVSARWQATLDRDTAAPAQLAIHAGSDSHSLPVRVDPLGQLLQLGALQLGWGHSGQIASARLDSHASQYTYNDFLETARVLHTVPSGVHQGDSQASTARLLAQTQILRSALLDEIARQAACGFKGWAVAEAAITSRSTVGPPQKEAPWISDTAALDPEKRASLVQAHGEPQWHQPDICVHAVNRHLDALESSAQHSLVSQDTSFAAHYLRVVMQLRAGAAAGAQGLADRFPYPIGGFWNYGRTAKELGIASTASLVTAEAQAAIDDMLALLAEIQASRSSHGFAAQFDYRRDALGRLTGHGETLVNTRRDHEYRYDSAGRLVEHLVNGASTTWTYDANGNRTHENGQPIASYDSEDRLQTWKDNTYRYNAAGDLTHKDTAAGSTRYQYDSLGNLRQVTLAGGEQIEYLIDPLNRRIGKKKNGRLQYGLIYQDGLRPLAEIKPEGGIRSVFLYGEKANIPSALLRDGKTYRIISDHLGSVRMVIDTQTGEVVQRLEYDVWGRVLRDSNPGWQPFGFAGGLYDPDTELTRFGARDYDAETGRWTAKDPILFEGGDANLYGYVLQDPVNWIDATGLCRSYWDRYLNHLNEYLVNVGPAAASLFGGVWPKSWVPRTNGRPPALGSTNSLTSVPRAIGIKGASSTNIRNTAAFIGLATVGVGYYNIGVFVSGLIYSSLDGEECNCER